MHPPPRAGKKTPPSSSAPSSGCDDADVYFLDIPPMGVNFLLVAKREKFDLYFSEFPNLI